MRNVLESVLSSYAEVHAAVMGVAFGLLAAAAHRRASDGQWLLAVGFVAGVVVGVNLRVSPWEGWWHPWYVLVPFAVGVYLAGR